MATTAEHSAEGRRLPAAALRGPDGTDRAMGALAIVLLAVILVAIARGRAEWSQVPWTIWLHLATMVVALALTPAILWRRRGDRRHKILGYVWAGCLFGTAGLSFAIRTIDPGHLSWIHLLSAFTLVQVPRIVLSARRGDRAGHRRSVRLMILGTLLIAGFFTLPFGRMLGHWLAG